MNSTKVKISPKKVFLYVLSILDEHRDRIGEINLTAVEEDVQDHFDMSDEEFAADDWSYAIFEFLSEKGLA